MEVAVQNNITSTRALDDYSIVKEAIKGSQKSYAILLERYRNPHLPHDAEDGKKPRGC